MTDERMALLELIEEGADADLVRELLARRVSDGCRQSQLSRFRNGPVDVNLFSPCPRAILSRYRLFLSEPRREPRRGGAGQGCAVPPRRSKAQWPR